LTFSSNNYALTPPNLSIPGKVNYVGHVGATRSKKDKLLSFSVVDDFSFFEPILRAGFTDFEIVNKATHYAGFEDSEIE